MKLAFRLGFILIPFLFFFLSQPAYPRNSCGNHGSCDRNALSDLKPVQPVVIVFTEASRDPASGSHAHQRNARLGECTGLLDLRTDLRTNSASGAFPASSFISDHLKSAAPVTEPYSANGVGAQAAVFHFGE